jgi:hypothetical protein
VGDPEKVVKEVKRVKEVIRKRVGKGGKGRITEMEVKGVLLDSQCNFLFN